MKTIEIRIPELGKAVGTTAWTAEKLNHVSKTLKTSTTKTGEPCLTYEHWADKDKGNSKRYVLAFIGQEKEGYDNIVGNASCVFPVTDHWMQVGLFEVLSEKSHEIVQKFLIDVTIEFWEKYNEN